MKQQKQQQADKDQKRNNNNNNENKTKLKKKFIFFHFPIWLIDWFWIYSKKKNFNVHVLDISHFIVFLCVFSINNIYICKCLCLCVCDWPLTLVPVMKKVFFSHFHYENSTQNWSKNQISLIEKKIHSIKI